MRLGNGLAFIVFLVFPSRPLIAADKITCEMLYQSNYSRGLPPLKLSTVKSIEPMESYSECVSVHVRFTPEELRGKTINGKPKKLQLTIQSSSRRLRNITIGRAKEKKIIKWIENRNKPMKAKCSSPIKPTINNNVTVWELVYNCYKAEGGETISVSFTSWSRTYSDTYEVPDPTPEFHLSVDQWSRTVNVTVEPGAQVYTKWCSKQDQNQCIDIPPSTRITIDPSQSQSAILNFTHTLPCLCLQVYYTFVDAERVTVCPFKNVTLDALHGVVTMYESSVAWSSECPARYLKPSASLCWKRHINLCTPVLNSTLEEIEDRIELKYNISSVDKHPQMCVQFSFQGSHDVHCPFQSGQSKWDAHVGPRRQSLRVYLTSSVPAMFSAQLCVLNERGCVSWGHVHSVRMERDTIETQLNVPLRFLPEKLCVQVWRSDPAQHGKRILCPDFSHRRSGIIAATASAFVVTVALLGILIQQVTKKGVAGWLSIQRPVLLVCSSEQSAQVSAVCALASILQGELCAAVRMALWAQSSGKQTGGQPGVADLGPLPWLYGQWDAVRKADGKVLIAWSPEAKTSYERWREERAETDGNERKIGEVVQLEKIKEEVEVEEDWKLKGRREGKCSKEKYSGKQGCDRLYNEEEADPQRETTSVTRPVFMAALACLQGALHRGGKGHGVALVYFQGLSSSRDIPKELRGVPRYCLPKDFGGLIQELGGTSGKTKSEKFGRRCWPRLLSKTLSLWLARRLAHRLRAWLPQTQTKKTQVLRPRSSQEVISEKTQNRFKSHLSDNMTAQGTVQEHEPLHGLP